MSFRAVVLAWLAVVGLVACGPSAAEIRTARTAHYRTTASAAFQAGVAALKTNGYQIATANPVEAKALSLGRWYEYDGTYALKDGDDLVIPKDRMVFLTIAVVVVADGAEFRVEVTPHGVQHRSGYSAEFPLKPDDPAMTSWIAGKVDNLYVSIYETLKADAVAPGT